MRWRRLPLSSSGFSRSAFVIEKMMVSIRSSAPGIDLALRHGLIATGQRADELRDAAHLGNLLLDFKEVVQVNVGLLNALGGLGLNLFGLNFRRMLDERNHVAHAQNALCHAIGMERLERIGFSPALMNLIGLPVTCLSDSAPPPRRRRPSST